MIDHAQRIREDLDYIFQIRKTCFSDKKHRINKFLIEIVDKISKEIATYK